MVALSQMAKWPLFGRREENFYEDIVTPTEVICENDGIVVITWDEKTAPPINARLQKGHCKLFGKNTNSVFFMKSINNQLIFLESPINSVGWVG